MSAPTPNPADRILERIGTRERDVVMKDTGIGQVAEPAPHQSPIRRRHLEEPLYDQRLEIEQCCRANSDENCAVEKVVHMFGSPPAILSSTELAYGMYWPPFTSITCPVT